MKKGFIFLIDETLRKSMEDAFVGEEYSKALELSRELDEQILRVVKAIIDDKKGC